MTKKEIASVQEVMEMIRRQEFRCALTGWKLTRDEFALDHIVPMVDGGGDNIENLQAVHPLANTAKGTMPNSQFVEMCEAIAAWSKKKAEVLSSI